MVTMVGFEPTPFPTTMGRWSPTRLLSGLLFFASLENNRCNN